MPRCAGRRSRVPRLWVKLVVCARTPCPELGHDALGRPNLQRHIKGSLVAVVKLVVYAGGKCSRHAAMKQAQRRSHWMLVATSPAGVSRYATTTAICVFTYFSLGLLISERRRRCRRCCRRRHFLILKRADLIQREAFLRGVASLFRMTKAICVITYFSLLIPNEDDAAASAAAADDT